MTDTDGKPDYGHCWIAQGATDAERVEEIRNDLGPSPASGKLGNARFLLSQHDALLGENKKLKKYHLEISMMSVAERCAKYHVQCCHQCERLDCCDNTSPAKQENDRMREALREIHALCEADLDPGRDPFDDAFDSTSVDIADIARKALWREDTVGESEGANGVSSD